MNILIVGNGGREHALAWKLRQSPRTDELYVAPGNAGTATLARNLKIASSDIEGLAAAAKEHRIGLTVVGPEAPLAGGIIDRFNELGLPVFGPSRQAARLESSKIFAKELMSKYGIPCARGRAFSSASEAREYVNSVEPPVVVKADGLAAGKGVTVAQTREEAMKAVADALEARVFGPAGEKIVIEEYLSGREVSVFAFTDGETITPLVMACDYKRVNDGDMGPNTGGMGSYSPPEFIDAGTAQRICEEIMAPVVHAMTAEGVPYRGVLYGGLMITAQGPKVLEFNVRLGDPETQVILPRLETDLVDIMVAVVQGRLAEIDVRWSEEACVAVVMASGGYPGPYSQGFPITGLESLEKDVLVFQAGTSLAEPPEGNGHAIVTAGGRILSVVGRGADLAQARASAYRNVDRVRFQGGHYRRDIAKIDLERSL